MTTEAMSWNDAKKLNVTDAMDNKIEGQPWPVVVTQGNLHYLSGGTDDDNLRCIPLNADNTFDPTDVVLVDHSAIEVELSRCCRSIAALLRNQIAYEG